MKSQPIDARKNPGRKNIPSIRLKAARHKCLPCPSYIRSLSKASAKKKYLKAGHESKSNKRLARLPTRKVSLRSELEAGCTASEEVLRSNMGPDLRSCLGSRIIIFRLLATTVPIESCHLHDPWVRGKDD